MCTKHYNLLPRNKWDSGKINLSWTFLALSNKFLSMLTLCRLDGPLIKYHQFPDVLNVWMFNPIILLQFDTIDYVSEARTEQLHVDCRVALQWMVFLKTRPSVKWNNTEFTNVSSFTSLLMCSTHFTLSCRIFPFSLPTSNNFVQFAYNEIPGQSDWQVLFRPPWCCLFLWQMKIIWTWLTSIMDFRYPGPTYLVQEVLVL